MTLEKIHKQKQVAEDEFIVEIKCLKEDNKKLTEELDNKTSMWRSACDTVEQVEFDRMDKSAEFESVIENLQERVKDLEGENSTLKVENKNLAQRKNKEKAQEEEIKNLKGQIRKLKPATKNKDIQTTTKRQTKDSQTPITVVEIERWGKLANELAEMNEKSNLSYNEAKQQIIFLENEKREIAKKLEETVKYLEKKQI